MDLWTTLAIVDGSDCRALRVSSRGTFVVVSVPVEAHVGHVRERGCNLAGRTRDDTPMGEACEIGLEVLVQVVGGLLRLPVDCHCQRGIAMTAQQRGDGKVWQWRRGAPQQPSFSGEVHTCSGTFLRLQTQAKV